MKKQGLLWIILLGLLTGCDDRAAQVTAAPDRESLIPADQQKITPEKVDGVWGTPTLMFSNFAGEASINNAGNIYFTHHYYKDDQPLEADIYIAVRK